MALISKLSGFHRSNDIYFFNRFLKSKKGFFAIFLFYQMTGFLKHNLISNQLKRCKKTFSIYADVTLDTFTDFSAQHNKNKYNITLTHFTKMKSNIRHSDLIPRNVIRFPSWSKRIDEDAVRWLVFTPKK